MTDRELLEAAAKAAGIVPNGWGRSVWDWIGIADWRPLTDDGDALRLAVRLRFTVRFQDHEVEVFDESGNCLVSDGDLPHCHRRAIVRAAAAMVDK